MYMKKDSGKIINVHPNTFLPMENQNLGEDLKGQSIKDLIDQGVLVKVGSKSEAAEAIKEKDIKVENKKEEEEEYQEEIKKLDDPQDKISTKNAFDDEKVSQSNQLLFRKLSQKKSRNMFPTEPLLFNLST